MTWSRLLLSLAFAGLLGACTTVRYSDLEPGSFTGSLFVMWIGEGGPSGDGVFVFVPDPRNPLTFTRPGGKGPAAVIKPRMMYTDGGSIPRIAQAFNGLSPWGYAPAYMIHDWAFVARHCLIDGNPDPRYATMKDVSFDDSVRIIGEAIQGLVAAKRVKADDVAAGAITFAVGSPVARSLWDAKGACAESIVSEKDRAAAEAAIPGSSTFAKRFGGPTPAKIVGSVTFSR